MRIYYIHIFFIHLFQRKKNTQIQTIVMFADKNKET